MTEFKELLYELLNYIVCIISDDFRLFGAFYDLMCLFGINSCYLLIFNLLNNSVISR